MSTLKQQEMTLSAIIETKMDELEMHTAWHGNLTGSESEALLRNMPHMTYLLRQGEKFDHFYLTYVKEGTVFTHLPFTIDSKKQQWFYRNYHPHFAYSLHTFIPEIMHQHEKDCFPLAPFTRL